MSTTKENETPFPQQPLDQMTGQSQERCDSHTGVGQQWAECGCGL